MSAIQHFFRWFCWIMDYSFLNIHNVWVILFVLGCFSGVFFTIVLRIFKKKKYRKYVFWVLAALIAMNVSVAEYICRNLPESVPRLENILDNAEFVLAGDSSQDKFLSALGLKKEYGKNIREIVYCMGEEDWKKVEHSCGNMNLYLQNIHCSIKNTIFFSNIHAGIPTCLQISLSGLFLWGLCGILIGAFWMSLYRKHGGKRVRYEIFLFAAAMLFLLFLSAGVLVYIASTFFSFSTCVMCGRKKNIRK